jgi:hypothetical protein
VRRVDPPERGGQELKVGRVRLVDVLDHEGARPVAAEGAGHELDEAVGDPLGPQQRIEAGALGRDRHGGQRLPRAGNDRGQVGGGRQQLDVVAPHQIRAAVKGSRYQRTDDGARGRVGAA